MAKPSWINVNPSSGTGGGQVDVTAVKNYGTLSRHGTLVIKTVSGLSKTIGLSQEASRVVFTTTSGNTTSTNTGTFPTLGSQGSFSIYLKMEACNSEKTPSYVYFVKDHAFVKGGSGEIESTTHATVYCYAEKGTDGNNVCKSAGVFFKATTNSGFVNKILTLPQIAFTVGTSQRIYVQSISIPMNSYVSGSEFALRLSSPQSTNIIFTVSDMSINRNLTYPTSISYSLE